jgi:hypothetical protein
LQIRDTAQRGAAASKRSAAVSEGPAAAAPQRYRIRTFRTPRDAETLRLVLRTSAVQLRSVVK